MRKYYLISAGSSSSQQMLADLDTVNWNNFEYIKGPININSKFLRKIFSNYFKLNAKVKMPFIRMWEGCFSMPKCEPRDENYIILMNGVFNYYSAEYLNRLKERNNYHFIIFLIDPLSGLQSEFMRKNLFETRYDYLYTFDPADAEKIGATYSMCVYSKLIIESNHKCIKGVYFAGTNKGERLIALEKIYTTLKKEGIDCKFRINHVAQTEQKYQDIIYNQHVEYREILEELQDYTCILEVLQPGQTGVTLRYYEAIAYNKKLITNNQYVKQLPFYNPDFIYVFNDPDEIDMTWIQREISVVYGYNNEFSPIELMKEIIERTSN